jgi:hypothetical protein
MTIKQAEAEIDRKHPGYWQAKMSDRKEKYFLMHNQKYAYWFYTWERDQWGDVILDDYGQGW